MTGHLVSHLVRRGVEHVSQRLTAKEAYVQQLQHDAQLYEQEGQTVDPLELLPMALTVLIAALLVWSIDYTVGQVISSLAMIESPSATAIIEPSSPSNKDAPPPYADEPDAPLEKDPLLLPLPSEAEADVEITLINHIPITAKLTTSIAHLHRIGGFAARWRGLSLAALYHLLHALVANLTTSLIGHGLLRSSLAYTLTSLLLCRVHLAWTQKMITRPSQTWWFRRLPSRQSCKALLLPTLVYAAAEQATLALPAAVALFLGLDHAALNESHAPECAGQAALLALRFLAVPATYFAVAFLVLLPASVTLTRIEAAILPATEANETIVPFDRAAVIGEKDLSVSAGRRALFVDAWRSFDGKARLRLVKLYAKMFLAQFTVVIVAAHLVFAEFFLLGPQRIATLVRSAAAQVQLAEMGIDQE